jgi:BirA family transcriptional regulator, biotin operon repressor / biotin---[acetyl-CoA-carboxylase] ligase
VRVAGTGDRRTTSSVFSRREQFPSVGSTNDVVRDWLDAGVPEVCLAVADEQTAGRGREGRTWLAPAGAALLLSLGFRPAWLQPDRVWRLAALVSVAMCAAAEEVSRLDTGTIRLKWPNDLVVEDGGRADPRRGTLRKLAGVLGETDGLGTADPRAVIGLGINVGWPAATFPAELAATMTSLDEVSGGRSIDLRALLDALTGRLEEGVRSLREGRFDADGWIGRQVTTGREVRLELPDGTLETVTAVGADVESGALIVASAGPERPDRRIVSGEIRHVRFVGADRPTVASAGLGV